MIADPEIMAIRPLERFQPNTAGHIPCTPS